MPLFDIEDDNGNALTLEGDSPPTEQELEEIYSLHKSPSQSSDFRGPEASRIPDMQATTRGGAKASLADAQAALSDFGGEISENLPGPGAMAYAGGLARSIPADLSAAMSLFKRPEGHKVGLLPASPSEIKGVVEQNLPYAAEASGNIPAALMGKAELPIDLQLSEAASEPGGLAAATLGHISQDVAATAPLLAIGLLPRTTQALVAAGFSAHMVASAPKLFEEYADEINKPEDEQDPDKIAKLQSSIAQTFGFAPLAGKHGASEFGEYASNAFEQANRFAPGPKTGGPRASDVAQPPLQMPMEIRGGDQNASEVSQAAEVHGDVRPPERQGQQEGVPIEEGGAGVQQEAQGGILTPEETTQFKELQNKFFGGGDMTSAELDSLDAFDARNRATMQARVAGEPPPKGLISESEQHLNDAVKAEGIEDKVNMVEPSELDPENPMSYRIAQFNLKTGKIDINGREFARALEDVPPDQRAKLARVMINEEKIHSFTTPQDAAEFGKNLSWVERKIGNRIYTGKFSGEHPGARMNDMTLGFEVIRRRIQRLNRMSPTEVVRAAGRERWTVESLDLLDRIVAKSREFLGDTGKAQRAAIDKIRSNIEAAKGAAVTAAGSPAVMSKGAEKRIEKLRQERLAEIRKSEIQDIPDEKIDARIAQLNRMERMLNDHELHELRDLRIERDRRYNDFPAALAKENEPKSVEDFVSRMAGEKFDTIDAVNAGFKAKSIADLEALRKAKADIREQMVEARKSGDFNKAFKLGSDNQMIREALETATSSGSNSVEMRRPHEAHYGEEPALNWKNNPEVRDWLEKHGTEVGIDISEQSPAALRRPRIKDEGETVEETIKNTGKWGEYLKSITDPQKAVEELRRIQDYAGERLDSIHRFAKAFGVKVKQNDDLSKSEYEYNYSEVPEDKIRYATRLVGEAKQLNSQLNSAEKWWRENHGPEKDQQSFPATLTRENATPRQKKIWDNILLALDNLKKVTSEHGRKYQYGERRDIGAKLQQPVNTNIYEPTTANTWLEYWNNLSKDAHPDGLPEFLPKEVRDAAEKMDDAVKQSADEAGHGKPGVVNAIHEILKQEHEQSFGNYEQSFPATLSKKDARRLEELRKYQEAMGRRPVQERMLSKGEAVAPEERVGATESGALPRLSATDMDTKADQILADKITPRKQTSEKMGEDTYQRWKRKHEKLMSPEDFKDYKALGPEAGDVQMRALFSASKNARQQFERPNFREFEQWSKRNLEGVKAHQIRDMWEDSVWSHLVNATPERLEEWRKALGLEIKYGKSRIAPKREITAQQEAMRFGGETSAAEANLEAKQYNRQAQIRRAQDLRGIEAADRYRNKVITAIAQKLIGESVKDRAELNRTEVTTDDIDFTNKESKHGPYTEISASDLADERALKNILRDQARTSGAPESESKRLVAVVDRKTGAVELVSTYSDAGVQRVTDPAGARLPGKPSRELNRAFLRQYRPFASVLLTDPVKAFRQRFESVSEFNEKIGKEAKERTSIGEFQGEGPGGEFSVEGTPGIEGEGGSFQGPHRTTMRRGSMESATRLTHPEAEGVLEQIWNEVGDFSSPDDVKMALMGLLDKSARGRMKPGDYLAQSAYRKMINALQREFPDRTREEVLNVLADRIYENNRTSETLEQYQQKTVAQFKGQNPENAGPETAPEAGTELTMPIERRPPTDVLPENVPPGTPPVERQKPPSAQLGSETPVREPYKPEVSPEQERIQRNAALRAGKEYQVGQDWAAAFGEAETQARINKRDIRIVRDRVRREQGITITPAEAKGILEAKRAFRPPMEMSNRAIFKRAERSLNEPLMTDNPAALRTAREGIDPDTKSPIPRLIPNISTAMTRALGIERIPLIGRLWGERAKIRDAADREMVAYSIKRGIGKSQAAIIGAREAALTKELGNPFEQAPDGKFLNVRADKSQSLYPSDLFEDWQRQFVVPEKMEASRKFSDREIANYSEKHPQTMTLTPEQEKLFRQYLTTIEDGYKYLDEKNAKLEDYGGESKETRRDQIVMHGLPKGVEVYPMPRLAMYKREIGPIKTEIRRRIGGSYQIERDRLYKTEAEGQRTTAYEPDMNKRLATFVERIYKSVSDADLANAEALKGETADQRIPRLSKEYEMELRTGEMNQQDIVDMGYRPRLGLEGQVSDHPAFADKIYPIDIANRLNRVFGDRAQRYIRNLSELSTISKMLMLTGDLAQYLQQGSLLSTRRPRIWADTTMKSIMSLADPHVTGNILRNPENMQAATQFVQGGGSLGHLQDFMSGAKPGEFLTKIPIINQVISRSGRAFGTFQDLAKLEVWKAVRDTTPKEQWPEMIESIEDLGLSGKMENAGMNPARAIGERLLLMAPSYYRGALNVVARAAEGGKSGAEARRSLFQYAAAWTTAMVGLYVAAGMSKDEIRHRLTPGQNNQKFLKFPVKVGNDTVEVGPGGIILSMVNLGADMAVTSVTKPGDMVSFKNPALKWIQQRLGPIPTFARKAATGEDVFGRKVGPWSAVASAAFPIPGQKGVASAMTANKGAGLVSAGSSFFGLESKKYSAATDVYQMAEDFMKKEGLKKESGFDSVANEEPSYSKLRGAVGAGSQRRFNEIRKAMTENRTDLDLVKQMKEWRDAPFTGSKKAENLFRAGLSDYESKIYEQAQEERQRVFDDFLDMLSNAP